MAKRAGQSMTAPNTMGGDETAAIRGDIERTRGEMSRTVNAIEERLSPAHLKEQLASVTAGVTADIEQKVAELKASVIGEYHEAKDHLKDDLGRELRSAQHAVNDEFIHARTAVRDATVGRVENMVHDARETVTDAGATVLDTIKANPIPAALIGVGIGWLIFGGRSAGRSSAADRMRRFRASNARSGYGYDAGYGYAEGRDEQDLARGPRRALRQGQRAVGSAIHTAEEGVSNAYRAAGEGVTNALHTAGHGVADLGHRVQEGASHLVEGAQGAVRNVGDTVGHFADDARVRGGRIARGAGRQVMRAERGVESTLRENPLALGAVAIAIGAAIGLSLPHTHVEDEWMGDAKDRLLQRAEGYAGEAIQKAENAANQLAAGEQGQQGQQGSRSDGKASFDGKQDREPETAKNGLSNGLSSKSQAV
jgi:hypothetical protein